MAARNRAGLSENTRLRIKTSKIVDELQKHVHGERDMTATQIRAAEILLKKTLPDLVAVELDGTVDGKLTINITRFADADDQPSA